MGYQQNAFGEEEEEGAWAPALEFESSPWA